MTGCILEVNSEELGRSSTSCRLPFVDPDLRVKIFFEKERAAENRSVYFEIGDIEPQPRLKVEENVMQSLSAFLLLFGDKK